MSEERVRQHIKEMDSVSREREREQKAARHPEQVHPREGSVLDKLLKKTQKQQKGGKV
jgi:hypothetical protein